VPEGLLKIARQYTNGWGEEEKARAVSTAEVPKCFFLDPRSHRA